MEKDVRLVVWLRCVVLLLAAVLLGIWSYFMWSMSMLVQEIDLSVATVRGEIEAVSGDMRQILETTADISRYVSDISDRVQRLEGKAYEALPIEEIESLLDAAIEIRLGDEEVQTASAETEEEIQFLLSSILTSGKSFQFSDKTEKAAKLYWFLRAKRRAFRRKIGSAEDFIAKTAIKSITGNPYFVVHEEGNRQPLNEWLLENLESYRSSVKDEGRMQEEGSVEP